MIKNVAVTEMQRLAAESRQARCERADVICQSDPLVSVLTSGSDWQITSARSHRACLDSAANRCISVTATFFIIERSQSFSGWQLKPGNVDVTSSRLLAG